MKINFAILLFIFFPLMLQASQQAEKRAFASLIFENDTFFRDDGLYSNGLFLNWGYNHVAALDDQNLPAWIAYLANKTHLTGNTNNNYSISYGFGQQLQTATDISLEELVEEDAPYVGLLAWEVSLLAYDEQMSDEVGLILGAVGPIAGGEFVQSMVHSVLAGREPQGWDNQISNELVFRLQTRRIWRAYQSDFAGAEFDLLTGLDGGVGNLRSDLSTGIGVRFGQRLTESFSSATVFPVQKFNGLNNTPYGWYLFLNASASYVANDIFINGNTFQDSHSVDLIHPQATVSVGFMANIYNFSILYTLLYATDEYQGQAEDSRFGSIAITYHF
ncbi:membrane protein [Psychromonas marina]|uniref:Membrane protein n=1 Tax=Psychromonas marina TaxID=88364 RepID=A0ABQ6DVU0_9GAMM|nr:lipid A deacylase LpxR family protein [Psychromonas marina]GLS89218.1 membrane protein [Psychromonas marina]